MTILKTTVGLCYLLEKQIMNSKGVTAVPAQTEIGYLEGCVGEENLYRTGLAITAG